jgi:hypothetical protein
VPPLAYVLGCLRSSLRQSSSSCSDSDSEDRRSCFLGERLGLSSSGCTSDLRSEDKRSRFEGDSLVLA